MFCPRCGKQIPDESRFCFKCGNSLAEVRDISERRQGQDSGSPGSQTPLVKAVPQPTAAKGFVVSRSDLEIRYASMADDDLAVLRRSELTETARNCLDQELNRRGIAPCSQFARNPVSLHEPVPALHQQNKLPGLKTVTTTDDALQIFAARDLNSNVLVRIPKGAVLDLGATSAVDDREWMEATLTDGTSGFVLAPSARGHTTLPPEITVLPPVHEAPPATPSGQPQPFEPFQHPRSVWTLNLFQWILLPAGGWAIILAQLVMSIPVLAIGLVVYALRRRNVQPHKPLAVNCDVCGRPAVGYKELSVDTGFLMAYYHFWSRGFLCERHTTEYVEQANELNLIGMFLKLGGFFAIGPYIKSRLQGEGNISIVTGLGAEPDIASYFALAARLYLSGIVDRDFDLSREFMARAASSNSHRKLFAVLCTGCAAAAQEAFLQGSKKNSLALLTTAEEALRRALETPLHGSDLSQEEVSLGRAIYREVENRIAKNNKRWM